MFWDNLNAYLLTSWRTTASVLVTGAVAFVVNYGITISEATQQKLINALVILGMLLVGFFAKDASVSGKPGQQQ